MAKSRESRSEGLRDGEVTVTAGFGGEAVDLGAGLWDTS